MVEDIVRFLKGLGAVEEQPPKNVAYRLRKGDCIVDIYSSGSVVFGGKGCSELRSLVNELMFKNSDLTPRIGCDEAGKGEYFGPLVIACLYADGDGLRKLLSLGVRDSKKLSESKVLKLADVIKNSFNGSIKVLTPEAYNKLYKKYNNLNKMLDDLYLELLEKSIKRFRPKKVIVDKFSSTLEPKLKEAFGDGVQVVVVPNAEVDPVVAAASIVAKAERIRVMKELEDRYGLKLPKGNLGLKEAVSRIPKRTLGKVAKLHFRVSNEEV